MVLSGLALAFSRLIDDSVVVIENIYRHLEMGEEPAVAAVKGTNEVALAVLAIMLVAVVVFFPVTFLFGVSSYLFGALALGVVLALFASYFDAVTVVPLFCANYLKAIHEHGHGRREEKILGSEIPCRIQCEIRSDAEFLREMGPKSAGPSGPGGRGFSDIFLLCAFCCIPSWAFRFFREPMPANLSST